MSIETNGKLLFRLLPLEWDIFSFFPLGSGNEEEGREQFAKHFRNLFFSTKPILNHVLKHVVLIFQHKDTQAGFLGAEQASPSLFRASPSADRRGEEGAGAGGKAQNGCQAPFWVSAFSCFLLFFLLFGGYQGLVSDFLLFIFKFLFPPSRSL